MKVVKSLNRFIPEHDTLTFSFEEGNNRFEIFYAGNLDLYWVIHSREESNHHEFVITKENYQVYRLFEILYDDIENINIYNEDYIPDYLEDEEEIEEYLQERRERIEEDRNLCRFHNDGNYNELFDKENKIITWHSDEVNYDVANILRIIKEDDSFVLSFSIQPHIKGYDRDDNSPHHITIRFRNSGSTYDPFNIIFMRMYNNMGQIDDVNDYGHQMHLEEYLYNMNKQKRIVKKHL